MFWMHRKMESDQIKMSKSLWLQKIETFIRYEIYPSSISSKDFVNKSNFRDASEMYDLKDGNKERDNQAKTYKQYPERY